MATWIALLRGINVGGKHLLPMKELAAALEEMGCINVRTYIQSGNVVFERPRSKAPQLAEKIGKTVLKSHGFEPRVLVLTVKELEKAATANPFPEAENEPKTLHLCFLAAKPKSPDLDALEQIKARTESYALVDKVFYLHAPEGIGRSKLAANVEKRLGVDATGRNWRTVTKLLKLSV
ncbi:MAG: DUF1697 domain-containing protein [Gammaproteobacteria bacterium]|nr:DUF1697 domain-containing protein [Gammaproteobacteria bacterium]